PMEVGTMRARPHAVNRPRACHSERSREWSRLGAAISTSPWPESSGTLLPDFRRKKLKANAVKSVAMFLVVSVACLLHTFAGLQPLFPIKPEAPFAKEDGRQ